jgi:RTX calcium-binding nonapeptide repeat (4 copies)
LRGDAEQSAGDRPAALTIAVCVILAFALGAGTVVVGKTIKGSPSGDVIKGTKKRDRIFGRGGDDLIKGKKARDRLFGNSGDDTLSGGKGKDKLRAGPGKDILLGGPGNDRMVGGHGANQLNMRNGVEQGSPGNDVINARNDALDEIDCGSGYDTVYVDRAENGVYDCENVIAP